MKNTSGKGESAIVPDEIKQWNWGAFLFNWIWGLANEVYIALLCLVPFIGIIMIFVIGVKGNEWAWRKKKWDSVEHFKSIQTIWTYLGLALLGLWIVGLVLLGILAAIVIPRLSYLMGNPP